MCLCGGGCRWRPGRNVKCGWERKRSCLGRVGVRIRAPSVFVSVASSARLKALGGFSPHAGLTRPTRPRAPGPPPGLCTQHAPHLLRSPCPPIASPVFLEPPPHAGSGRAHPDGLPQRPCPGPGPLWTDQFALHMSCCDPDHCQSLLLETELPQVRTGSVWGPST